LGKYKLLNDKEYQREWYQKNKDKAKQYQKTYREKHRDKYNKSNREQSRKKRAEIRQMLGNSCTLCGWIPKKGQKNLSCHEIHGKTHKDNPYYIIKNIKNFIPLCKHCHKTLHLYHRYKTKIEELEKLLKD